MREVDRLAVTIVTDTQIIKFIPTEKRNGLTIERRPAGNVRPDAPPRADLVGEWGLSMHAQSQRGSEARNILIDFGYMPDTLNNNISVLKLDPAEIDALVLSHGHYDHFGGLVGFLAANKGKLKRKLPFFIGGEDCFCTRESAAGQYGALDRKEPGSMGLGSKKGGRLPGELIRSGSRPSTRARGSLVAALS